MLTRCGQLAACRSMGIIPMTGITKHQKESPSIGQGFLSARGGCYGAGLQCDSRSAALAGSRRCLVRLGRLHLQAPCWGLKPSASETYAAPNPLSDNRLAPVPRRMSMTARQLWRLPYIWQVGYYRNRSYSLLFHYFIKDITSWRFPSFQ